MTRIIMKLLADPPASGSVQPAILKSIEGLVDGQSLDYGHGPSLRFVFELSAPEFKGLEASAMSSTTLNQRSKLFRITTGILGRAPADGEDVTEALRTAIGKGYTVKVDHRDSKDGLGLFLEAAEIEPSGS